MNRTAHSLSFLVVLLSFQLTGPPPLALLSHSPALAGSGEEGHYRDMVLPYGFADWTRGVMVARGWSIASGLSSDGKRNSEQTRNTALTVAQRNLLEGLSRVYIDASVTVGHFLAANEEARKAVDTWVHNARIVREIEYPDGSFELTLEIEFPGELASLMRGRPQPQVYTQVME